jgi:hypothetical protein
MPCISFPTCLALLPNTNSIASMTFDLPEPFGPTTADIDCKFSEEGARL